MGGIIPNDIIINAMDHPVIRNRIKDLHELKDSMNSIIKELNAARLHVFVEVHEVRLPDGPSQITGIELSVMQEIYP